MCVAVSGLYEIGLLGYRARVQLSNSLAIMGLKHSGKSSVSKRLAATLRAPLFDIDEVIASRLLASDPGLVDGLPDSEHQAIVRAFYRKYGADKFHQEEISAFQSLLPLEEPSVIACGGGSVENEGLLTLLKSAAIKVFLDAQEEVLFHRIIQGGIPAFLDPRDPKGSFHAVFERRRTKGLEIADVVVETRHFSSDEISQILLDSLLERNLVRRR